MRPVASLFRGRRCAARVARQEQSPWPKQHDMLDAVAPKICHAPVENCGSNWYRVIYASQIVSILLISILTHPYTRNSKYKAKKALPSKFTHRIQTTATSVFPSLL